MKKRFSAFVIIALMLAFVTGCGSSGSKYASKEMLVNYAADSADYGYYDVEPEAAYDVTFTANGDRSYSKTSDSSSYSGSGSGAIDDNAVINSTETGTKRKVIKNASLKVETLEFDNFIQALKSDIEAYNGYIERSNVTGDNIYKTTKRSASFTIRIPEDKIEAFIDRVNGIGTVTATTYNEDDITLQYVDVESRIKTLYTEQETLLKLLEKADIINDVIELEARLSQVNYEIENYTSRLRTYDNQITFSTVNVNVSEVDRITPVTTEPEKEKTLGEKIAISFTEHMDELWDGLQEFIIWAVTHIIGITVWIIIIVVAVVLIRKSIKKDRERKAAYAAQYRANAQNMGNAKPADQTGSGNGTELGDKKEDR